ncbi:hypothetical protein CCL19_14345, partial [Pseudomonas syringae]
MFAQSATLGILALGLTCVVIGGGSNVVSGGLDLSLAANLGLCAAVYSSLNNAGLDAWQAIGLTLGCGLLVGAFNGLAVVFLRLPPLLATLASMNLIAGLETGTSHYFDIKTFQAQVAEVKRLGGTPITLDAGRNDKNLVNQLQTVVTQKPDAVIQTLGTLSVIDPWLKRISKAGIPLFTIDAPSQYSLNNTTSDNVATGKALAGQLIKDAGGQGNVLVFNGFYGVPVCAIRYDQLKLALKDHPQLKIIEPELRDVIPNTV